MLCWKWKISLLDSSLLSRFLGCSQCSRQEILSILSPKNSRRIPSPSLYFSSQYIFCRTNSAWWLPSDSAGLHMYSLCVKARKSLRCTTKKGLRGALFHVLNSRNPFLYSFVRFYKNLLFEFFLLVIAEFRENPVGNCIPGISTDSCFIPWKFVGSEVKCDRFESILTSGTSFISETNFSEIHIDIVWKYENILFWNLIEIHQSGYRFARKIHKGHRLQENNLLSFKSSFGNYPFKFRILPVLKTPFISQKIHEKKPDIVSGVWIFFSRITKSDDEFHLLKQLWLVGSRISWEIVKFVWKLRTGVNRTTCTENEETYSLNAKFAFRRDSTYCK